MMTMMMMTIVMMTDLEGTRDDDTIQSWSWSLQQCILEHNNVDFNLDDDDDSHPDENDNEDSDDYTDDSYIVMTRMIILRAMMIMIRKR